MCVCVFEEEEPTTLFNDEHTHTLFSSLPPRALPIPVYENCG